MKFSPISGILLLAVGVAVLFTMKTATLGIILIVAGAGTLVAALILRNRRPGDDNQRGMTGIN